MTARTPAALTLVLVLAVLAPLAVAADVCEECVSGAAAGCCLPACGACVCCGHVVGLADDRGLASPAGRAGEAWQPAAGRPLRTDPSPVFHVPKRSA